MLVAKLIFLLVGLALLVKGSDLFVLSSSVLAKRLGVSEFVIGLTLVSIGTSVPEFASSLAASFEGASGIVIGNVIGSNIANIGLIVSSAAILSKVKTEKLMLRRDGYIMFFATILFYVFALNFEISRLEAFVFLLFYASYIFFLLDKTCKHKENIYFENFIKYFYKFKYIFDLKAWNRTGTTEGIKNNRKIEEVSNLSEKEKSLESDNSCETGYVPEGSFGVEILKLLVSGIAVIIGARYFVNASIFFAKQLEIPETIIGMSLMAIGTSLPEFMVTISAARIGYANLAIGNVIGSNITNLLLIAGCSAVVCPLKVTGLSIYFIMPFLLFISCMFLFFLRTDWEIKRFEGLILLLLYLNFMVLLFYLNR